MTSRLAGRIWVVLLALLLLSGCDQIQIPGLPLAPTATESTPPPPQPTPTSTSPPVPAASPSPATLTLRLWLPPEFDPASGELAAQLLQDRLNEFQNRRPNIKIETRIKAVDGAGGMINTLSTANAAAPLAVPDLVALPRRSIETAVQKGLLYAFDELGPLAQADWFEYALESNLLSQNQYSLPFAGDTLSLVYRPEIVETPPDTWEALRQIQYPLLFPAASPQAAFTLTQYLAAGGVIEDSDGRPILNVESLTAVYIFYQQASAGEQMPFWLTQYENDDQVWQAYQDERGPMAAIWLSTYLRSLPEGSQAAPLPTPDGSPYTLSAGWVWAIPNPDPLRRQIGTELAVFLSDADFLASWTQAAGYLPTREEVLNGWEDAQLQALARQFITSAHPSPSPDILNVIGPALQETTIDVLKQQDTPAAAAQKAVERVSGP
jgi:ABC-type glycerol-3-phosphate transport system substrate-binding protein